MKKHEPESARSTHQNQLHKRRQRMQGTCLRHRQNAYLGPMQNSKMHTRRNFRRKKGSAIVRRIGARQSFSVKPWVARESRQSKNTENEHYIMNLVICSHGWYKSSLMRERLALMCYIFDICHLHGWEASSWTKQLFLPPFLLLFLESFWSVFLLLAKFRPKGKL